MIHISSQGSSQSWHKSSSSSWKPSYVPSILSLIQRASPKKLGYFYGLRIRRVGYLTIVKSVWHIKWIGWVKHWLNDFLQVLQLCHSEEFLCHVSVLIALEQLWTFSTYHNLLTEEVWIRNKSSKISKGWNIWVQVLTVSILWAERVGFASWYVHPSSWKRLCWFAKNGMWSQ